MCKRLIFIALMSSLGIFYSPLIAQDAALSFMCKVSATELLQGNILEVSYTLEGSRGGKFIPPDWASAGFDLRGGPNQSSSFSMVNGVTSSTISYTYFVSTTNIGEMEIPVASIETEGQVLTTKPLIIKVLENPNGIIEPPKNQSKIPAAPKNKRPTIRI